MSKILVVDDRPLNRELLRTLLQYKDHEVIEAAQGEEALHLARQHRPDLIITDIVMPTMNGYEFVRRLRADPDLTESVVIFYTASYKVTEAREMAKACKVSHILFKPCEPQHILDIVQEVLSSLVKHAVTAQKESFSLLANTSFRLTAMSELCLDLSAERDPAQLLEKFCLSARELVKAQFTSSLVYSGSGLQQEAASCQFSQHETEPVAQATSGFLDPVEWLPIMKALFRERDIFCLNQPEAQLIEAGIAFPAGFPAVRNILGVSLRSRAEVYGWLCCFNASEDAGFDEQDQQLLLTLAAQVGQTYENSVMYAQMQSQAQDLKRQNSELEQTKITLSETVDRLRMAKSAGGFGVWDLDISSNHMIWDKEMYLLFDLDHSSDGDLLKACFGRLHPDDLQEVRDVYALLSLNGQDSQTQYRLVLGDKTIRHLESFTKVVRGPDDIPCRLIGIVQDISKNKLAEKHLRDSRADLLTSNRQLEGMVDQLKDLVYKSEAANLAKSEFLTNMSHELR
ncbi:MAG: response regulator, partial [Candidatus Sericytochromatia bacterium]